MKRDNKKALYESIMTSVAKEVKKVLNEDASRSRMPQRWRGYQSGDYDPEERRMLRSLQKPGKALADECDKIFQSYDLSSLKDDFADIANQLNLSEYDLTYMGQNYYSRKKNIIGLFRYLQWVHENGLWNKVGEAYMIIGNDDDPQSHDLNLPTSLVVYNPNPVPIRIKYMIFS